MTLLVGCLDQLFDLFDRGKIQIAFAGLFALALVVQGIGVLFAPGSYTNMQVFQLFKLFDVGLDLPIGPPRMLADHTAGKIDLISRT